MQAPYLAGDALIASDGARLPTRRWLPATDVRATVLAVHGFNDYSESFDALGGSLAGRGIAVYAYDQRGFGRAPNRGLWPGEAVLVRDLTEVFAAIGREHPGTPLYILGDSMGGAVAMVALARGALPKIEGAVLVAPAVWGRETMNPLYRLALWTGAHTLPWLTLSGRGLGVTPSDNVEMLRALGRDPLVIKETRIDALSGVVDLMDQALVAAGDIHHPLLVLYGARDEIIPKYPTAVMLARLSAPHRVAIYDRGYHMLLRDLQAATVHRDVAAWIADPAAALPSGADGLAVVALARDSLSEAAEAARTAPPAAAAAP